MSLQPKSRLKEKYQQEVLKKLAEELKVSNKLALPKVEKVVVNMGVGAAAKNKEVLEQYSKDIAAITGQSPSVRLAKVSAASFNLRRGMRVGLAATLRGDRMYSFLDRLFSIVLPRLRDFRGVPIKSFDSQGNYTLGIPEHTVFPEVDLAKSAAHGLEITVVTSTKDVEESKRLLELLGMPFAPPDGAQGKPSKGGGSTQAG